MYKPELAPLGAGLLAKCLLAWRMSRLAPAVSAGMAVVGAVTIAGFAAGYAREDVFDITQPNKAGSYEYYADRHLVRRGFTFVWLQELLAGMPARQREVFAPVACDTSRIRRVPIPDFSDKMALIQVESLDYKAIGLRYNGVLVAPFLTELAGRSILLEIDGRKKFASANSDYEVLTGLLADQQVCYYAYQTQFLSRVTRNLDGSCFDTVFLHNSYGSYMNRRNTMPRLGFRL